MPSILRVYLTATVTFFALDLIWLGFVAKGFYRVQLAPLLRPDIQWLPAVVFYLIYVAAITALVILPAIEKQSLARALWSGALFGLAAYAAYDLTSLSLIRDFPLKVALVDLAWGTTLTTAVAAVGFLIGRR